MYRKPILFIALLIFAFALPSTASAAPWHKVGKVMSPTQAWEQGKTYEPTVLYRNGLYRMWYTGGDVPTATGYATSKDGRHWRKHGIVLGLGRGGFEGETARNSVIFWRGIYYLYFSNNLNLYVATSKDGQHFRTQDYPVLWATPAPSMGVIENSSVIHDGDRWVMMFETRSSYFLSGLGPQYVVAYAVSSEPTGYFQLSGAQIDGLGAAENYGGPCLTRDEDGGYTVFYHASVSSSGVLPTDIYSARSDDLVTWTNRRHELTRSLPFEFDQVADPVIVHAKGRTLMYYDGDNNPAGKAAVGLAIR